MSPRGEQSRRQNFEAHSGLDECSLCCFWDEQGLRLGQVRIEFVSSGWD